MASVGVLGGGIAGLTAAFQLQAQGLDVTVLEASARTGGKIRSERCDEYLVEHGPNTLQSSSPLLDGLIDRLGLDADCIEAQPTAKKRYIVRDGTPRALPTSPIEMLTSDLLSLRGKLRLLGEPFIRPGAPDREESVAEFVERRLGAEALDYGVNPFVAGIFAGDPKQLSIKHTFRRLVELEQTHGSLTKGVFNRMRANDKTEASSTSRSMFSFREGLQQLPDALTAALGPTIQRLAPVTALRKRDSMWTVVTRAPGRPAAEHTFDGIISTLPLHRLSALATDDLDVAPLARVAYSPVSVVAMGFRRADVQHPLDGFGMLVPEVEADVQILGTLFPSTLFANRAPEGHVLLASFVGGARHPELGTAETETLAPLVQRDLERLLGTRGDPVFVRHVRWKHAIPQYTLGYGQIKAKLEGLEARHPRLAFAGNYRAGVSVGDTMESGDRAARRLIEALGKPSLPA